MNVRGWFFNILLTIAICFGTATAASAQWYFAGYLGVNATQPADISVKAPASQVAIVFKDVKFAARPFESPQYYGWRFGAIGDKRRFGLEGEFIHLKVYAKTTASYAVSGTFGAMTVASTQPMSTIVQRYAMSHGLNFLVVNAVVRQPVGSGRAQLVVRAGAGPTIPHTETTVLGAAVDKYESGGLGIHAAAGLNTRIRGRLSLVTEYKFTRARPAISVAGGTGQATAATHHLAVGLAFGISR
jgi:hypothetical protein